MKAVIIIDHGSRYPAANDALFEVVNRMQELTPDIMVKGAHMELCDPSIQQVVDDCVANGATHIIAHPYMLSPAGMPFEIFRIWCMMRLPTTPMYRLRSHHR